jgi:hypothetical protein
MYTTNLNVSDYGERNYKVEINASWLTIVDVKTDMIIAKRHADGGPWYDEAHQKAVDAMRAFEEAIYKIVDLEARKEVR